jgi:methyltransferase (TIGR00027 family)
MLSSVGTTSLYVAAARAYETEYPQRLFVDPYARLLAGNKGFELFAVLRAFSPGLLDEPHPGISIRTRFFDDALLSAVSELSLQQVVLVAAGMDARAFRLPWMDGVELLEVDRQEIFDYKEPILMSLNAKALCKRQVVPIDLEQDWASALTDAGFDPHKPTAFLFEGLIFYLKPYTVAALLKALQTLAYPGSWLGMDLIEAALLSSPYAQPFLNKLKQLGCPWHFGVSNPEQFLRNYGWQPTIVVLGEPEANYDRWNYPVSSPISSVFNHYLITARRVNC